MSRLRVVHRTTFTYANPVRASYNEARMRPASHAGQRVLESTLTVAPQTWAGEYRDYWGTRVDQIEVLTKHQTLTIVADSRVERDGGPQRVLGSEWSTLATPAFLDRMSEMLMISDTTRPPADLVELARERAAGLDVHEAALAVSDALRGEMEYVPGVTGVHTRAAEAWDARKGVCQDIVHLTVGTLRTLGIPARYVSGYLHPRPDAPLGEPAAGESHAWVEFWSGDWFGYDPTNTRPVGDHHVLVARGREYRDVTPLRGVYSGGGRSTQQVEVLITAEA